MCEFCTRHGEGKKWYLQMRNFSRELVEAELTPRQSAMAGAQTRIEWIDRYFNGFTRPAIGGSSPQGERDVVPPVGQPYHRRKGEARDLARKKVVHFGQVLPIEDVEQVVDRADSITRMPCGCRFITTGKTDKRYCFGLGVDHWGILGRYPEASASLEVLDKAEAKEILRHFDEEGLVHSVWCGVAPYVMALCNCDADCVPYRSYVLQGGLPSFFRAEYVCEVDADTCTGCKSCLSQCHFGALLYSSGLERVYIDPVRCFGCGLCRAACSKQAIQAVPRLQSREAANIWLR